MIISPPFLPHSGLVSSDAADPDPMMTAVDAYASGYSGIYPVAFDRRWHGGVHLDNAPANEPVRAIADGEVVAYRVSQSTISDGHVDEATGKEALNTNIGFVLLRHVTETGAGRTLTYYSLYMHLLDLAAQAAFVGSRPSNPPLDTSPTALSAWLLEPGGGVTSGNGKRVYRKDILGYMGQSQGLRHLHFEIFMTQQDFTSWFDQAGHIVQVGHKRPVQPTCQDWWGHAYYIIPGSIEFVDRPGTQNDTTWFPKLRAGKLPNASSNLYVETYFHIGQRYMRAWIDENGDGNCRLLTPQPVKDPYDDYEYKLYERSMALYPGCPSDGYELLRFGRILSTTPTLTSEQDKTTWVAVPFNENGSLGYVDINRASIVKLSDADFPFFAGWRKIDGRDAPLDGDGLFSYQKLSKLFGNAATNTRSASQTGQQFGLDGQLIDYIRNTDGVQESLSGFICESKSEWDPVNNDARYRGLNRCDGYFGRCKETNPDGYDKFLGFVTKLQFLDQVPALSGGRSFWYFHPLAFIRHFRKCGWLAPAEMASTFPKYPYYEEGDGVYRAVKKGPNSALQNDVAKRRIKNYVMSMNCSMRKYGISVSRTRQSHFLAQVLLETDRWNTVEEYGRGKYNPRQPATQYYAAFYGRGCLQLTWASLYEEYGKFMSFPHNAAGVYADPRITRASAHWFGDPRRRGARNGTTIGSQRLWFPRYDPRVISDFPHYACDSAGFFWVHRHYAHVRDINRVADRGVDSFVVGRVSVLVNGGGNGFYERQAFALVAAEYLLDCIRHATTRTLVPSGRQSSIVVDLENAKGD
jgi:hypothetical protein